LPKWLQSGKLHNILEPKSELNLAQLTDQNRERFGP
jgi:hypothetical protein